MVGRDMYIRLSDPTGKHSDIVSHHRVWDVQLFLSAQVKQHTLLQNGDDVRHVDVATEDDYRKFMNYKGY